MKVTYESCEKWKIHQIWTDENLWDTDKGYKTDLNDVFIYIQNGGRNARNLQGLLRFVATWNMTNELMKFGRWKHQRIKPHLSRG